MINDCQLYFHFDAISDIILQNGNKIPEEISQLQEFIMFSCSCLPYKYLFLEK